MKNPVKCKPQHRENMNHFEKWSQVYFMFTDCTNISLIINS